MTGWLTPEWIVALNSALREATLTGETLVIAHVVDRGVDQPSFDYTITIDHDGASASLGAAPETTVTFSQTIATAQAICEGKLAPGEAILLGHVTTTGNVAALVDHRETLKALNNVIVNFALDDA